MDTKDRFIYIDIYDYNYKLFDEITIDYNIESEYNIIIHDLLNINMDNLLSTLEVNANINEFITKNIESNLSNNIRNFLNELSIICIQNEDKFIKFYFY